MMMRLMFIVICVVSCVVFDVMAVAVSAEPLGFLSRNLLDSGLERKIGSHCNFSFQTGNDSCPVDTARKAARARAASLRDGLRI